MEGTNIIGFKRRAGTKSFRALDPATGKERADLFWEATSGLVDEALTYAIAAFPIFSNLSGKARGAFLRAIGQQILDLGDSLVEVTRGETGLPAGRIQSERGRTVDQLNQFAELIEKGSWVEATIDTAIPDRRPSPRPFLCRMLVPLGPVAVFGASNFPLAFSVAGGDTASALAAGNPVIVKAHPGHPGCSVLVGGAIVRAAQETGMPEGVFSLLLDEGTSIGKALVGHPELCAVGFTGSYGAGMALCQVAAERKVPIPVFAEMGSINPVILFPGALEKRAGELASQTAASVTLGSGQFCTNPGLILAIHSPALETFVLAYGKTIGETSYGTMLSPRIATAFHKSVQEVLDQSGVKLIRKSAKDNINELNQGQPTIARVDAEDFVGAPRLQQEVFGPFSLLVCCRDFQDLKQVIDSLAGQLTFTIHCEPGELRGHLELLQKLREKAGRIIFNGMPTGVEVSPAMHHGGPFPASTDARFTSVGIHAIKRFVKPICFQNWEDALLPPELQASNPLQIVRRVNGVQTKNPIT
ncbi:MAG TPA: aldehyde dehydrogenase (NADP(+)) [Chitinophagaceae bacterium]|nr:aldehyde dehydrogenase (NADP(+)) [Chitinophagaceae bacterium]